MSKLQKLNVAWHAEAVSLLNENFGKIHAAFTDATKRAVWLGMFLNHIKAKGKEDGTIPHGEFGTWMKKNAPDVSWNQANRYMALATNVCEGKFEIVQFAQFAKTGELPPPIEKVVEGKTQQQLFLQFKNVDSEGNARKAGRLPGDGGNSKEVRDKAITLKDTERLAILKVNAEQTAEWLLAVSDLNSLARLDEVPGGAASLKQLVEAVAYAHSFFNNLKRK